MRLGVIGAMEVEVALLKEAMGDARVERFGHLEFYCGTIGEVELVVVRSGVGKVFAAMCTQALIDHFAPDAILNTGIAGALDPRVGIGDFVVSVDCIHHDYDIGDLGDIPGAIPDGGRSGFASDPDLRSKVVEAARRVAPDVTVLEARIASGDQFVADGERKRSIVERFGGSCVDMESASIAQASWANDVPFVVVRAISDKADGTAVDDYPRFEELSARQSAQVVLELAGML